MLCLEWRIQYKQKKGGGVSYVQYRFVVFYVLKGVQEVARTISKKTSYYISD